MTLYELIILSLGLAMDATAVSFVCSICDPKGKKHLILKSALWFGFFQAIMPLFGYLAGTMVNSLVQNVDHWIAFVLLTLVGGKMLFDRQEDNQETISLYSNKKLFLLAIATSIDALVVGVTFSFMKVNLIQSILMIGIITFGLSLLAGYLGRKLTHFNSKYFEIAGGLAIISIGIKILLSHIM